MLSCFVIWSSPCGLIAEQILSNVYTINITATDNCESTQERMFFLLSHKQIKNQMFNWSTAEAKDNECLIIEMKCHILIINISFGILTFLFHYVLIDS